MDKRQTKVVKISKPAQNSEKYKNYVILVQNDAVLDQHDAIGQNWGDRKISKYSNHPFAQLLWVKIFAQRFMGENRFKLVKASE